jgi:hypothetical protein
MNKCYLLFFFSVIIFLNYSCKKEITPAYLLLSEEDFKDCINVTNFNSVHETNYSEEELEVIKQQYFRDVLVSLNGKELGYWQLPCKIPLLPDYSDKNYVRVIPCARIPYTSLTAAPYYFLTPVEQFFEMEKEGEYRLSNFKIEYVPSVAFPILETFSQTTAFKPFDTIFPTPMEIYYDKDYDNGKGKNVGKITLEDSVDFFNVVTSYFYLNGRGVRQYWEMYYKCESGEMVTYLNFQNAVSGVFQQDMIVFPATTTWKKAYIDLTDIITWACGSADRISVRLGIRGNPVQNKEKETASNSNFYFGNIKVITMSAPY